MSKHAPPLLTLARLIDTLNARFGQACAWLTLFLVLGTAAVVIMRYGFHYGAIALQESVMYAHALVFMGAAAWTLQRGAHVRVDIFYQKFSPRRQALVDLIGHLVFLIPVCLFLGWNSWDYVANSWKTLEGSNESDGLKFVYLQKTIILILIVSLCLQALADLVKFFYQLRGVLPTPEPRPETKHG